VKPLWTVLTCCCFVALAALYLMLADFSPMWIHGRFPGGWLLFAMLAADVGIVVCSVALMDRHLRCRRVAARHDHGRNVR